jgi:hypothetical protein
VKLGISLHNEAVIFYRIIILSIAAYLINNWKKSSHDINTRTGMNARTGMKARA